MFIKWHKGIVDLGITTKEFLEEYCILLENLMHGNIDAALLWLRLLAKYLVKKYNLKRSKADSCIFFEKYDKGYLELVISVHVEDVLMAVNPETSMNTKEKINQKFNISESSKVRKFLRFDYEWVCDTKSTHVKITMDKYVKKLVEGYYKYTGSDVKVQKNPGAPVTNISKIDVE